MKKEKKEGGGGGACIWTWDEAENE